MLVMFAAALIGPLILSVVFTYITRGVALRVGFVDRPGVGHKQHARPTALGGGVALLLAITVPIVISGAVMWSMGQAMPDWFPDSWKPHLPGIVSKLPTLLGILGCATILCVVGLVDDRRPLGPNPKFVAQIAVAIVTAWILKIRAAEALSAPMSIVLTVLWIVLITNAFNFLDNMDGLSAGVAAIAAAIFAVASFQTQQLFVPGFACLLVGALAGFLFFNFSPASIFMGDAGSMPIGYLLSVLTILTTFYDPSQNLKPFGIAVPLLVLAVPLYDVASVVIHRIRAGESPLRGDRRHFSHRLVRRGLSTRGAVLTIYLATAATGLPAIALPHVGWFIAALLVLQCLCTVTMIAILEHVPHASRNPPS